MKRDNKYLWVLLFSLLILALSYFIENKPNPPKGEYFWSKLIQDSLTLYVRIIFALLGFLACYYLKLTPWKTALSIFAVFPIVSFIEGTIYRGSHNLIPLELIGFFLWSLPTAATGYLGQWLEKKRAQSNIN